MVATTPNEIMDSPVDRTKTAIRIARRIRQLPGVRSVKTAGLYVPKYSDDLYPLAEPETFKQEHQQQHRHLRGTGSRRDAAHRILLHYGRP